MTYPFFGRTHRLLDISVTFTDGRKIFMGSSGTGAPKDGRDPVEAAKKKP